MGQQSILHAVKARSQPISKRSLNVPINASIEEEPNEEHDATKPLSQTLTDLQFSDSAHDNNADKGVFIHVLIYRTFFEIHFFLFLFSLQKNVTKERK